MFNTFDATINGVSFKAKSSKGAIRRLCEITLETDFTDDIASGIGKEAIRWRKDLKAGSLEQVKIPISAIACRCEFECLDDGQGHVVPEARGMSAIANMSEDESFDPRIKIKLGFSLSAEDASWFSMQIGNVITVDLNRSQLSLVDMAV